MKKLLFLFILFPLLSLTVDNEKSQIIGKWVGEDNGEIGYMGFDANGFAYFEIDGQTFGGREFIFEGKKGSMTYKINESANPIEVDLIVTKLESGETNKLLCIAKFIDHDTMKFAINFENKRPLNFNTENSILFKREK